jgi:hypothetical protein
VVLEGVQPRTALFPGPDGCTESDSMADSEIEMNAHEDAQRVAERSFGAEAIPA